jgi:prephenate dehydrogenase
VRVAILGFGLIGGSIALALSRRGRGAWSVTAWSPGLEGPRRALSAGAIAAVAPDPQTAVRDAEIVVLAAPPLQNLTLLDQVAPLVTGVDVTVTDVSSSQAAIAARAVRYPQLHFVGGHPMSGREKRGYSAARDDLFDGRTWAVLASPSARPVDVERVRSLAEACGAEPLEIDAQAHDEAVAAVSHLPLLASVALAETVAGSQEWPSARRLAAQGWRDMTRLARGDPELATGISVANAHHLAGWLGRYREAIAEWQRSLEELAGFGKDAAAPEASAERDLRARFERAAALAREEP